MIRIRDWRVAFLFLLLCAWTESCWGACPLMTHKDADIQREFQNVCQTITNPIVNNAVVSSSTITTVSISSASISTATITNLHGTTTNNNACPGCVGEYVESVVANVACPAINVWGDATSISLTAGDWDVSALAYYTGGTGVTVYQLGISQTSGNSTTGLVLGSNRLVMTMSGVLDHSVSICSYRQSLSGTTTIYAKMILAYTGGSPTIYCRLSARRVR